MQTKPTIKVTPITSDYVHRWDKIKINTNNLGKKPHDYPQVLDSTNTQNWIYRFHDPQTIHTLTLDKEDLEWMQKARKIGRMTRKFSKLYQDDLQDTLKKYTEATPWFTPDSKWFIRTPRVSLKNGQHGPGPYTNLQQVLESLVSSNPGHDCFNDDDTQLTLYFMPFLSQLDDAKEFRIFIHNHEITAISQQALFTTNPWLTHLYNTIAIEPIVHKILDHYNTHIKEKMQDYLKSYTMDLALIGPELQPYFIEPNPFGGNYSAGSALFGWEQDHETLHDPTTIEFRFTIAS
jgi:hypothetical protein